MIKENLPNEIHRSKTNITQKPKSGNRRRVGRKRRQIKLKERSEAVIIQPTEGNSFADVLKNMRTNVKPEEAEVAVRSIRKTKTGAILLELGKGGKKNEFCDAIKGALKDAADVRDVKTIDRPLIPLSHSSLDSELVHSTEFSSVVIDTPEGDVNIHFIKSF